MINPGTVRKIAVLRANGIGDYILSLPALDALRLRFPAAEIVLLGQRWHSDYLTGRPGPVDRVVELPTARGVTAPADADEDAQELASFLGAMRREAFDLAFQLHDAGRWSNAFIQQLGARHTFGPRSPDAAALDFSVLYIDYQPETFRYIEVVALAGARPAGWEARIAVTQADHVAARPYLPAAQPLVVLHVGASDSRRRWPIANFAAVGDALVEAGAVVAVEAIDDERLLLDVLKERMHSPFIDLGADCTLSRLTGVLANAALIVANDSGPLHLAHAVGTASVGIYWSGNLINAGAGSRSRHRPLISWRVTCPECGANTTQRGCTHVASFVADVPPDEVIRETLGLLRSETAPPRKDCRPAGLGVRSSCFSS
ncbi:MAG TPA: glycosyltransferase family 9 protein [Aromatoleum sp.]|nr:glycosyltransferase family 9 protein [Aromatoleum sp.]